MPKVDVNPPHQNEELRQELRQERYGLLYELEDHLEKPMILLGFVWLIFTVLEFTGNLSPFLSQMNTFIWVLFIIDFTVKFLIAPDKGDYVKKNWLTLLALVVPALRIFRLSRALSSLRLLRASGGIRFVTIVSTFNRGMKALGRSLGRRGFGYVLGLTMIVTLLGSAGIYAFEHETSEYITNFGSALWWTAMVLTTMGADFFPQTPEGRLLCLLLATYGFAIFGYVTATVASFFVEREAANPDSEVASAEMIRDLQRDLQDLKKQLNELLVSRKEGPL